MSVLRDASYGRPYGAARRLDLYWHPNATESTALVLWIPAGRGRDGTKEACGPALALLARGIAVAAVNYRSESGDEDALRDVEDAIRWIRRHAAKYRLDPDRVGLFGISRGGLLAGRTALAGSADAGRRIRAVCAWHGLTDARLLAAVRPRGPAFLFMHGGRDAKAPLDHVQTQCANLRAIGNAAVLIQFPGCGHDLDAANHPERVDTVVAFFERELSSERDVSPWTYAVKEPSPFLRHATFRSRVARGKVGYAVYLPPGYARESRTRYPVIYWLHGLGNDPQAMVHFARRLDMAILDERCPPLVAIGVNGLRDSMYCNSQDGVRPVERVMVQELIPHVERLYRVRRDRRMRAIEGFSMGGFGAAHLGMKYPYLFGGISMMAPAMHTEQTLAERRGRIFLKVFGGDAEYCRREMTWALLEKNATRLRGGPRLRMWIGTAEPPDRLRLAVDFHRDMEERRVDHEFRLVRGVEHDFEELYERGGVDPFLFYRQLFAKV